MKKALVLLVISLFSLGFFQSSLAAEDFEVLFFYSPTCPHCISENHFLDDIEDKYPDVVFNRYSVRDEGTYDLLREITPKYGAEKYVGLVPITFVGEDYFLGFDDAQGVGAEIEESIQRQTGRTEDIKEPEEGRTINIPLIGRIDLSSLSLPVLTIVLGIMDGFNVCSLGALILILGLVLVLKSRRKIMLFGSIFILTTGIAYGLLLVMWYQIFNLLGEYIRSIEIAIGLLGISGSIIFFRQFLKFRKYGPMCESASNDFVTRITRKLQNTFQSSKSIFALAMSVFIFAFLVTLIEFPCSAAIPLMYAGILSEFQLTGITFLFYIILFMAFYLIDELIIFLISVWKLEIWLTSPRFTVWITLIEALVLGFLGIYYLFGFF